MNLNSNDRPPIPSRHGCGTPLTAAAIPENKRSGRGLSVITCNGATSPNDHAAAETAPMLSSPPPALLPHLRCLFISKLRNPSLLIMPVKEFWSIVENMFIHVLSDSDLSRLEQYLDPQSDVPVSWSEANTYFQIQFTHLKARQVDLWVGLKALTGVERYFWYNLKDDSSRWMSDQEAIKYVEALSLPAADRCKRHLVPTSKLRRQDTPATQLLKISTSAAPASSPHNMSPCSRRQIGSSRGAVRMMSP